MVFDSYFLLKLAHILLFVYWLGGDIGVFYSATFVRNGAVHLEGRRTALKILVWVDQIPRYCLVLMLPVGYTLALRIGVVRLPPAFLALLWVIGFAWLWMVWAIHHYQGKPLAETLRRIDFGIRVLVILAMVGYGLTGLAGGGAINQPWLAAKALLYGALVFCGLMIRVMAQPFGPAFAEIMRSGSAPEAEARLNGAMNRARPFVVLIWIGLVAMAYLGAVKPQF